jgi:hypothetical protein
MQAPFLPCSSARAGCAELVENIDAGAFAQAMARELRCPGRSAGLAFDTNSWRRWD